MCDCREMAELSVALNLGPVNRQLPRDTPMDAEELAMLRETDTALGVTRDRRNLPRTGGKP